MSRRVVVWLIPVLLTLHNAEEALTFGAYRPKFIASLPARPAAVGARVSHPTFVATVAILSALVFALAWAVDGRPRSVILLWLLLTVEVAIGLNGIAHLVSALFIVHGYTPGLVTGVVVNVPFATYCVVRAQRERWLGPTALRTTLPAAIVLHGPVLIAALWLATRLGR